MAASKREVIDSDDDGDDMSPLSSPLASPQLSPLPLPPIETTPPTETREATIATNLAHTSTSTDPSFFRDVYEEQQRAIGAQLAPFPPGFDDSYHDILTEGHAVEPPVEQSSRDPWEVPSSPIEVAGQQRGSYLKRKREEGGQASRQSAAAVVQLDNLSSGNASGQANTKKQKKTASGNVGGSATPALETISIPLEPLTPSRLHQYPRLLSSSFNNNNDPIQRPSLDLSLDMSLEAARPLQQPPYEQVLPLNEDVTQSTIAFTTPSLYASSGRRAPGSSNNNSNSATKQLKSSSSHDMDIVQEQKVDAVVQDATPPIKARKAADMAQIMSSPDIIAEPKSRASPRNHSPLPEDDDLEDDEEGGVEWGMHSSHPENPAETTRSQSAQRQSSIADELSISIDVPVIQSEVAHDIYESGASYDLPKQKKKSTKTKRKSPKPPKKKAVFIAASDDDEEDIIVAGAAPPAVADSESDFSDVPAKSKATATKGKRGPKKKTTAAAQEVLSVEILPESAPLTTTAKRPRGRPKRQKTPPQEAVSDNDDEEDIFVQGTAEDAIEIKIEPPETKTDEYTAAPDSEADSEAQLDPPTPVRAKGKKGKKVAAKGKKDAKAGRGRKATEADVINVEEASHEIVEEKTVLGKTSGNASATSSFKAEVEDKKEVQKPAAVVAKVEKPAPVLEDSKPAASTTAPERALLNTGLNTTASQGKVPYRVGLSKKFRIAPLLKMIRK